MSYRNGFAVHAVRFVSAFSILIAFDVVAQEYSALREKIYAHMQIGQYWETMAERHMQEWGDAAVPILIDGIRNGQLGEKAVFYLGKTGNRDAVQSIIDYIRTRKPEAPQPRWGYYALGWLGFPEAVEFLLEHARDPATRDDALNGLEQVRSRDGAAAIKSAISTADADLRPSLQSIADTAEAAAQEAETLAVARTKIPAQTARLRNFWKWQTTEPNKYLAKDIVGRFEGRAYTAGDSNVEVIDDVFIHFKKNGTFDTNLKSINSGRTTRSTPTANAPVINENTYKVLSPTQLVLGAGEGGISTVTPMLRDDTLSFVHVPAGIMVVLTRKNSEQPKSFTPADFSGVYRGNVVPTAPQRELGKLANRSLEITFTDSGGFIPCLLDDNGERAAFAHETYHGKFLVDPAGLLVTYVHFGGGDYIGSSVTQFFDWYLDGTNLHMTVHDSNESAHLAVTTDGSPLTLRQSESANMLTRGTYRGSAFRSPRNGQISEIPNVWIRFDADGTYHTNWIDRLRENDDPFYPRDGGRYRLASPRHLLLEERWEGESTPSSDVTTDLFINGDTLCFTSLRRKAYFVLERASE